MLEELENIDDDCEIYGINFVKIIDQNLAKRYGIKNYPALVYFRNGNPLIYDGKLYLDVMARNSIKFLCSFQLYY